MCDCLHSRSEAYRNDTIVLVEFPFGRIGGGGGKARIFQDRVLTVSVGVVETTGRSRVFVISLLRAKRTLEIVFVVVALSGEVLV